jgi:hypothetical protein
MRKSIFFLIILILTVAAACKKSQDVIRDNVVPTGVGYYPVSSNTLQDVVAVPNTNLGSVALKPGYAFKTELQYFSQDAIKEVNFYTTVGTGTRTKILTVPYTSSYSNFKKLDTLLVPYTVPTGLATGTSIKLEYEILNQNTLNLIRTATIRTQ